jgi:hypothetical protein
MATRKSLHLSQDSKRSNLAPIVEYNSHNQNPHFQRSVTTKDHAYRIDYNAPLRGQFNVPGPRPYNIISGI